MLKKTLMIVVLALGLFVVEYFLFSFFGRWFKPNLLLLLTMFFTLYLGIRFGLIAAVLCGLLKDSFTVGLWGVNIFSFVMCAFMTTILRKYVYMMSSQWSRGILIFSVLFLNMIFNYFLFSISTPISFFQAVSYIFIPEAVVTLCAANLTFDFFKKCVSKLSV